MSSIKPPAVFPRDSKIRCLFESIAGRYDFLNSLLSLRLDGYWRARTRDIVLARGATAVLDLGTGTGKLLQAFLEKQAWERAVGIDFSIEMLRRAQRKLPGTVGLVLGDFHELPLADASFDLVISGFALRSVRDLSVFFSEVHRVLKPGGRAAFLCLTRPRYPLVRTLYSFYLKFYIPLIGRIFSGRRDAYEFLSSSIQTFQDPAQTADMMQQAGWGETVVHSLSFGIVTLITGRKN